MFYIKYYWLKLQIMVLEILIKFSNKWERYKQRNLERYVTAMVLASYNYDPAVINSLNKQNK